MTGAVYSDILGTYSRSASSHAGSALVSAAGNAMSATSTGSATRAAVAWRQWRAASAGRSSLSYRLPSKACACGSLRRLTLRCR
ncbi:Uncharacterised protein [Bordetella pertussis]|nr:Uncharacterised protein [Bordetella pertussis]CPJ38644.1 Uncharacterised protein [Bordetella pertussis]CPP95697.1 Uncharacterised protein [Bordetella pertussis]CPQ99347.1 Uncharacterised protein [Bordetella pertussis]